MSPFPDTSFLFALYHDQVNSDRADRRLRSLTEPLLVSSLLLLEFRQSVRFHTALHRHDRTKGLSGNVGTGILIALDRDLTAGLLHQYSVEWVAVHGIAERLSALHTLAGRHRLMDILHVSTALHLGAKEFLTFDENQKRLALKEGLKVSL